MRILFFFLMFPLVYMVGLGRFGSLSGSVPIDASVFRYALISTLILLMLYWIGRLFASLSNVSVRTKSYISIFIALVAWLGFPMFIDAVRSNSGNSSNFNLYYQGDLTIENGVQTEHGLRVAMRSQIVAIVSIGTALILGAIISKITRRPKPPQI